MCFSFRLLNAATILILHHLTLIYAKYRLATCMSYSVCNKCCWGDYNGRKQYDGLVHSNVETVPVCILYWEKFGD